VAAGTVFESVKVKFPAAALGIEIEPVVAVTVPLLVRVVETVRLFAPIARVLLVTVRLPDTVVAPPRVLVPEPEAVRFE
jgi:hypothetical protein